MIFFATRTALAILLPVALAAGCGGGTTLDVGSALPGLNNVSNGSGESEGTDSSGQAQSINGRVADGYLQGATVCIDMNENGSCDTGEPTAISGQGGTYQLDIPANGTGKPIIADVPASAIDEDTGEPIGKRLTLSTPADRPGFISPITTLVHEELKSNPNLSIDDAEGAVLEVLGMDSDDGASLFEDYVAEQDSDDEQQAERYRFLHQTARVVATMMDDIQQHIEQAAVDNGLDLSADETSLQAMRQLIREEVRELLPEISLAVAEEILGQESANEETGSPASEIFVDTAKLIEKLDREEPSTELIDKLDAIRDAADVERVAMEKLLKEGMYWLEVECDHQQIQPGEEIDASGVEPVEVMLSDDGIPMPVDVPRYCYAEYGYVSVEGEANELTEQHFEYNAESRTWIERTYDDNEPVFGYHLKDGQWVAAKQDGPAGPVEFLDDGSAVLQTELGKMVVYGTSHALDNTPVVHHIYRRGGQEDFLQLVDDNELFPEGSAVHRLLVKRQATTHMLFNWHPYGDESACDQFNGNCNVVDIIDDAGFAPASSLADIRQASVAGVNLAGIVHNHYEGRPIDLQLNTFDDAAAVDTLPVAGIATWIMPLAYTDGSYGTKPHPVDCATDQQIEMQDPAAEGLIPCSELEQPSYYEECYPADEYYPADGTGPAGTTEQDMFVEFESIEEGSDSGLEQIPPPGEELVIIDICSDNGVLGTSTGSELPEDQKLLLDEEAGEYDVKPYDADYTSEKRIVATSEWKTINVDGVQMIEVSLPVQVRHSTDAADHASLLLVEEGGFVRRGARLRDAESDDALMYSPAAFETLQPIAEEYVISR